jgi:hypothetical protein
MVFAGDYKYRQRGYGWRDVVVLMLNEECNESSVRGEIGNERECKGVSGSTRSYSGEENKVKVVGSNSGWRGSNEYKRSCFWKRCEKKVG